MANDSNRSYPMKSTCAVLFVSYLWHLVELLGNEARDREIWLLIAGTGFTLVLLIFLEILSQLSLENVVQFD